MENVNYISQFLGQKVEVTLVGDNEKLVGVMCFNPDPKYNEDYAVQTDNGTKIGFRTDSISDIVAFANLVNEARTGDTEIPKTTMERKLDSFVGKFVVAKFNPKRRMKGILEYSDDRSMDREFVIEHNRVRFYFDADECDGIYELNDDTASDIKDVMPEIENGIEPCGNDNDLVNHPSHYTNGKYEVIEVIKDKITPEQFEGYCIGNVMKYIMRYQNKNGLEDLQKGLWYLNYLIEYKKNLEEEKQ